ncbi:MAG: hypothetical protein M1827_003035 [Pycnora praestabilis]|nr:MAG: hypothetical protein M1827_003035 [Pycnora praestabilis]
MLKVIPFAVALLALSTSAAPYPAPAACLYGSNVYGDDTCTGNLTESAVDGPLNFACQTLNIDATGNVLPPQQAKQSDCYIAASEMCQLFTFQAIRDEWVNYTYSSCYAGYYLPHESGGPFSLLRCIKEVMQPMIDGCMTANPATNDHGTININSVNPKAGWVVDPSWAAFAVMSVSQFGSSSELLPSVYANNASTNALEAKEGTDSRKTGRIKRDETSLVNAKDGEI